MELLNPEHRKMYGKFAGIEWNDQTEIKRMRSQLDFDAPLEVSWDWDYVGEAEELRRLYEISKVRQWNAETDLDWKISIDPAAHWGMDPKYSVICQLLKLGGASEAQQREAAWENMAYICSQLLHGEQAALQICGQLTNTCPDIDMKFYAGAQTFDEVRHIEAFAKFLQRKVGKIYPVDPNIKFLLEELLKADSWQKKTLGMQTLFEGMALGIMGMLEDGTDIPFLKEMLKRVRLDESRHAAFGIISMKMTMESAETSPELKAELEDWAFGILECLNAGQYHGPLSELGPKYGINASAVTPVLYHSKDAIEAKSLMYTHAVIPHLKKLGLITERTAGKYRDIGLVKDMDKISTESRVTQGAFD